MWSNFDPHDKQNFAPQTMSAASGTIMMYANNKPYAKYNKPYAKYNIQGQRQRQ